MNTFPDLLRKKQQLSPAECTEVLRRALRGVLAVNGEHGYPYALPINFYYDEAENKIYFHSGKIGYKLDCIKASPKACFTAQNDGERKEGDWWLIINSVVAFGELSVITDADTVARVSRLLSLKFTDDNEYIDREIQKYGQATILLCFSVEHITGKVVREK